MFLWLGFSLVFKGCIEDLENGLEYTSKMCIGIADFQCGGTISMKDCKSE